MKSLPTLREKLPGLCRAFAHLWPYVRKHRLLLAMSLAALIFQAVCQALEPWPLKYVFDALAHTKRAGRLPDLPALHNLSRGRLIALGTLAILTIAGLRVLADYAGSIGLAVLGNRVLTRVRGDLYRHLQRLPLAFHTRSRSGELVLRVIADINQFKSVLIDAALPLAARLLVLVLMFGMMFWLNWKLTLVVLAMLPLFGLSTLRLSRRVQHSAKAQRKRDGSMAATATETMGAIQLVQALSLEEHFAAQFTRQNQESQKEDVKALRWSAALGRGIGFLIAACTAAVLWFGARLVLRGELTPGELLIFLAYMRSTLKPVQELSRVSSRLARGTAAGERVFDLLETPLEVHDLPGAVAAPPFQGAVRFDQVRFAYQPGQRVLEGVDFEIAPGRRVALVGPSGIGKSTLVNLLLRFYDPSEGRVLIDGHDVREYTLASLRAQISVVLQDTVLFATTVRDNIGYGRPGSGTEAIEEAARLANADEFIRALPQGYNTVLGERGVTLSGGQRQRIAIARAALRRAPILVLDEPTTGLDDDNERAVLDALDDLAEDRTAFFITHDLQLAARADLILYLEGGRVVERGSHAELIQAGGRYATLYTQQLPLAASPPAVNGTPFPLSSALATGRSAGRSTTTDDSSAARQLR
jgi:ATP-binding cassette subfamily B protein